MAVAQYENGNKGRRTWQNVLQSVFRREYVPEHIHGGGRRRNDSLRFKLPRKDSSADDWPRQGDNLQKSAFLAAETSVNLDIFFNQKLGSGFFGGEGFIMQKLSGSGTAFIEIDGEVVEYDLANGEQIVVDTGNVAGFEPSVGMDIKQVAGLKNKFLGGEGFFNTLLTGPGKVWIQTMPISGVANALRPYFPSGN